MDNSTNDKAQKLVQYLDGNLEGAEKDSLEQQLTADAALQQQFDSLLLTREAIRYYGLKEKVKSLHQVMMEEMVPKQQLKPVGSGKRMLRYAVSIAASILLLVGGYFVYNFVTLSSEKVYGAHYQRYELSTTRDAATPETAAEKAYRAANYKEVVRINTAKEDETVKGIFLTGIAAMELKDNSKAIACFTEVLEANKKATVKSFSDETEYYLSLSYIRNKDYDYALELMQAIKDDPAHTYHEKITSKLMRQVKLLKWR